MPPPGTGGRDVCRTEVVLDMLTFPLPGKVRAFPPPTPLGEICWVGTTGMSNLVGTDGEEPTLSGLKVSAVGVRKPVIFSKPSFCRYRYIT